MWIRFTSDDQFAINVSVGGVNAISGEPLVETSATQIRRLNLMSERKTVQDYVVTPQQLWLDSIASTAGRVRQFVAVPMGNGYTVEAQVTGEEVTGGLQFQVTLPKPHPSGALRLFVKTLTGKTLVVEGFSDLTTTTQLKRLIRNSVSTSRGLIFFLGPHLTLQ